jgi:hypothetical protein
MELQGYNLINLQSVHPRYMMAFKTPPGLSVPYIRQPEPCHLNIFPQYQENIQGNKLQIHSFFNYIINRIFGQLHTPDTLLPGKNSYTHQIRVCVVSRDGWDNVASCILYFHQSVHCGMHSTAS